MSNINNYVNAIQKEQIRRRGIRKRERDVATQESLLGSQPLINRDDNFKSNLMSVLPKHLIPSNVGGYEEVLWPFWFNFEFNFNSGDNTVIPANGITEVTKQISQEAAFIAVSFYRDFEESDQAGRGLPVQLTIRDRQSSRQLNDNPILLQHIGEKGEGTKFPTPYIFMPNSRVTLEVSSILGADYTILNQDSTQRITMFGYRIRTEDASKIAKNLYL